MVSWPKQVQVAEKLQGKIQMLLAAKAETHHKKSARAKNTNSVVVSMTGKENSHS